MASRHKPIWYEGMTLDPQHFQQWDRYYHGHLNDRLRSIQSFDWGVADLDIDREALANGQFTLRRCVGVTRDGLSFDIPGRDPMPPPRSFAKEFGPTEEKLEVFLAVAAERPGGRNCDLDSSGGVRQTRYVLETLPLNDDNTGSNERQIGVGRPLFSLMLSTERLEEFSTIPIAQVVRSSEGTFVVSPRFIPPSLSLAGSDVLTALSQRMLELLVAKSNALAERRRQQPSGQVEFSAGEITAFWLLHTLNSVIPLLNHACTAGRSHPETVYRLLLSLAGQLATFTTEADLRVRDLPRYDHAAPTECFHQLDAGIRRLLETVISTNVVTIALEKRSETVHVGRVSEEGLLRGAQFFLSTSGDKPERTVIDDLPRKAKISAPEVINQLVIAAQPGLPISHTPVPPVGLPARSGLLYFRMERSGPFWDGIARSGSIAIYIPAEFKGLEVRLFAVKERA